MAERALCANPGGTAEVKTFVPEVGTKAVSYTHLDVYKRQALNGENMTIFCSKPAEYTDVLQNWWVQQALAYLGDVVNKWYPVLGQDEEDKPVIKIRKMKTLCGSCTSTQRTIRFNYYLMCASAEGIEYVVLHELTHLLYPDHGAGFKAFLSRHMPDWKERKRRLESQCAGMRML